MSKRRATPVDFAERLARTMARSGMANAIDVTPTKTDSGHVRALWIQTIQFLRVVFLH